ncbi:hypothetical protein ANCDUO_24776 [Ancylostoma duodenale]|uniref:Uncharacterized protein n=1 Tax=Ancylostoma duodenale TaxID=51022 RepID=A0A0C2C6A7_9BILA|nr:hypothetical protein ANCDUO_24776 [Ancylostoma duodenale]
MNVRVEYMKVRIDDHPYARIQDYFDQVADKIKAVKFNACKLAQGLIAPKVVPALHLTSPSRCSLMRTRDGLLDYSSHKSSSKRVPNYSRANWKKNRIFNER